jgi:glycosyltransferase involved in cell wall biosynthesis
MGPPVNPLVPLQMSELSRDRPLRILQVSTCDIAGGAEKVAWDLFGSYRALGYDSWLAVGTKRSEDPNVIAIPRFNSENPWGRFWLGLETRLQSQEGNGRAVGLLRTLLRMIANPRPGLEFRFGMENFNYPGSHRLLHLARHHPDIIHCHNLHGAYFDLRALPWLSRRAPLVMTLHDAWLLSGHCAHSFACERWKSGCGNCPDLGIYPAINRDATAHNWRRKRAIYRKSRLFVATPSRWLMGKVEQSILAPAIERGRVIPYGVNLNLFRTAPKEKARADLALPQDAEIVLFTANGIRRNIFKDYQSMREAIARVGATPMNRPFIFLALGESGPTERIGEAEVRFIPYQRDAAAVAHYYQAADVYLHSAKVDTFPNAVLEALACGTPVIGSAVGGIPEQVKALEVIGAAPQGITRCETFPMEEATGLLVAPGDAEAIASGIRRLLANPSLRACLGRNAAKDARQRFDLRREVESYVGWYEELLRVPAQKPTFSS